MRLRRAKFLVPVILALAVGTAVTVASASREHATAITPAPAFSAAELAGTAGSNWLTVGGSTNGTRFSTLNQIKTSNINSLKVAWQAHFGLSKAKQAQTFGQEATPVVYNGIAFVPDAFGDVVAIDGATGEQQWKFTNRIVGKPPLLTTQRGIAIGEGRVYVATPNDKVIAIDQATGRPVWSSQVGQAKAGESMTAAPLYFNGMVVVGMSGGDTGARGFVQAMNAKTGRTLWKWWVTPSPGQPGSSTWTNNEWKHSGSVWVFPTIDANLGLLYVVTGNPVPWNGRAVGANKWTDSIVALHIRSGKFAWGFQTVHHDIWDYDVTNPPVIFDDVYRGVMRHGIAVASKTGWVYILDRATGKPLVPIVEKKVPGYPAGSDAAKYANLSPTQPYPQGDSILNQCPRHAAWATNAPDGKPYRVGCIFTPYSVSDAGSFTAFSPGPASIDWPPPSYNPQTHLMYVCSNETTGFAIGAQPKAEQKLTVGGLYVGVNFAFSKVKAKVPGRVTALDLRTNRIVWRDVFPSACYSGILTTSSGLLFMGQVAPRVLTAIDVGSGKKLWHSKPLAAAPMAPPITYMANGKQYIMIVAGGGGGGAGISGKLGDSIYAFALP